MPDAILARPLAIIGKPDVVRGFKALGFTVYTATEANQIGEYLHAASKAQTAVCLVQEEFYNENLEAIAGYRQAPLPIFIPFSDKARTAVLDTMVRDIRLKATGAL
jgi:vacuolar-type H+-ATPase subunit F/Vma7